VSEIGWWEMVSQAAAPRLRQHVLGYCGYEEETVGFTRRRELPSGEVIVIIGFGPKLRTTYPDLAPDRIATHRSFVAGLHETHCFVESPGTQAGIQVNLTPLGAHLLLGLSMRELTNRVVELDGLLGAEGELCVEVGCSRRHMLRRFNEQVGIAPKTYARVLRFQRAVHMLGHRDGASWTPDRERGAGRGMSWGEIALECGYFDQAHMNRDFRQFAGASPSELAASLLPDGGGLAG
jgi:AraC-like DNA-binding protein